MPNKVRCAKQEGETVDHRRHMRFRVVGSKQQKASVPGLAGPRLMVGVRLGYRLSGVPPAPSSSSEHQDQDDDKHDQADPAAENVAAVCARTITPPTAAEHNQEDHDNDDGGKRHARLLSGPELNIGLCGVGKRFRRGLCLNF